MKIYLVGCVRTLSVRLTSLIDENKLGEAAGSFEVWEDAFVELRDAKPDVLIADIRNLDNTGLERIRRAANLFPDSDIFIFSSAYDAESVEKLYIAGVSYILHKPLNEIELSNVLKNTELSRMLKRVLQIVPEHGSKAHPKAADSENIKLYEEDELVRFTKRLKGVLREIGILSESGSKDIIDIATYLFEKGMDVRDVSMRDICGMMGDNTKSVEQRIRRAAGAALSGLAARGMDDYADPIYNEYGDRLFGFEQMRNEINFICGKSFKHGNIKIKKFIGGLLDCCMEN
jgi:response regulator